MPEYRITAHEIIAITRTYKGKDRDEAVGKMSRWICAQEDVGRTFTESLRVEMCDAKEAEGCDT